MEMYRAILSDKEIEDIKKIYERKKDIMTCIDMKSFIEEVKLIVAESDIFDFRNADSSKYIDVRKPVFKLRIADRDILENLKKEKSDQALISVTNLVNDEIVKKISVKLLDELINKEDSLFSDLPKDILQFMLTNIYIIRASVKENNIQLNYFI